MKEAQQNASIWKKNLSNKDEGINLKNKEGGLWRLQ
jgi:hypothetical protein